MNYQIFQNITEVKPLHLLIILTMFRLQVSKTFFSKQEGIVKPSQLPFIILQNVS